MRFSLLRSFRKNLPTQASREEPVTSHASLLFCHFRALASWLLYQMRRKRPVASPGFLRQEPEPAITLLPRYARGGAGSESPLRPVQPSLESSRRNNFKE